MKKIVGDLLKNRNIEESLKKYTGGFMKINNKYALIRLAMNYYTYYVSVSEDGGMVAPGFNMLKLSMKQLKSMSMAEMIFRKILRN